MQATKYSDLFEERRKMPFFQKINLWSIDEGVAVGVDFQMSVGFELFNHPDVGLKTDEEIEGYLHGIRRVVQTLPENVSVQFVVQAREGDPKVIDAFSQLNRQDAAAGSFAELVVAARADFLRAKFIMKRRYYAFFTTWPIKMEKMPQVNFTNLYDQPNQEITESLHRERLRQLNIRAAGLEDSLRSVGLRCQRMDTQALGNYYFGHLNPKLSMDSSAPNVSDLMQRGYTARSILAQSATRQEYGHFFVDGVYHKAVNMLVLPENVNAFSFQALSNHLWPSYDLVLTMFTPEIDLHIKRLESAKSWAGFFMRSSFMSRYAAAHKYEDIEHLVEDVKGGTQKLLMMSLSVVLKADTVESVDDNALTAVKGFQDVGAAIGLIDNLNHEDLFLSVLPNHAHFNSRVHSMNSEALIHLMPMSASWTGTEKAKMLFENPNAELVKYDIFDASLPAKHALLIGMTGAGKSFATNFLLTNFFVESALNHIVVIDVGGSYRKLTHTFEGQYFRVALSDEFAFNPFPEKGAMFNGKEYDPDELAYLTLIIQMMALDKGEILNSLGETILEKAIKIAYDAIALDVAPILSDVREALVKVPGDTETKTLAKHYFNNLEVWTEGRYAKVFNSKKRLNATNRLIVFDLQDLAPHPRLQSVYFYVIRELIDSKLRNKTLKKMIVIDEGWSFFSDEIGSRLIENLYRTARKSNGMVLSISQSPADFLKAKASNAIIENSYVKYFLRGCAPALLPQFGLTSREVESVSHLTSKHRTYSEFLVKFHQQSAVLRLEPSPLDYWICTTDAEDEAKENQLRQRHPAMSYAEVLRTLAGQIKEKP